MKGDDALDDLLVRARREPLTGEEERRLSDALASSEDTRLLYEAGRAFDREAPVEPGDDERIQGMLAAVARRRAPPVVRRPRRSLFGALAVGLLLGGAAGAALGLRRPAVSPSAPVSKTAVPAAPAPVDPRPERVEAPRTPAPPPPGVPSSVHAPTAVRQEPYVPPNTVPSAPVATAPAQASFDAPVPGAVDAPTASALFAAANRARVSGDSGRAIELYRRLDAEFPRSSEALTARLSLGLLLLQKGESAAALEQFRAYEALGRGPTLVEAYWGEAQALRKLARPGEERAALQRLVERFPDSAYARASQNRLRELESR
ncbi:MAG TPA: tetratricopeptide repeat protein [Polyangiaceae bacterium]